VLNVTRIVEYQASLSSYRATQNEDRAVQLELLIESTKPNNPYHEWHPLIATPFRYSPPYPTARFRPPFSKHNIFYGALNSETALYEHAFHFMRERRPLKITSETGQRTLFSTDANNDKCIDLRQHKDCHAIMNKYDYSASHQFIENHPDINFILYPSCRDPKQRDNAAILDIHLLDKQPKDETSIKFFYDFRKETLTWIDHQLAIQWSEVC
jgi:hypothetical protein